jgi:hypothetical protein
MDLNLDQAGMGELFAGIAKRIEAVGAEIREQGADKSADEIESIARRVFAGIGISNWISRDYAEAVAAGKAFKINLQ